MADAGYLLHGAVHSERGGVEAVLSVLPIILIIGTGFLIYRFGQHSAPRHTEDPGATRDYHGDEPV